MEELDEKYKIDFNFVDEEPNEDEWYCLCSEKIVVANGKLDLSATNVDEYVQALKSGNIPYVNYLPEIIYGSIKSPKYTPYLELYVKVADVEDVMKLLGEKGLIENREVWEIDELNVPDDELPDEYTFDEVSVDETLYENVEKNFYGEEVVNEQEKENLDNFNSVGKFIFISMGIILGVWLCIKLLIAN